MSLMLGINSWIDGIINGIIGAFYGLFAALLSLIDIIQDLFRKMAGLDPVYYAGDIAGEEEGLDIITRLLLSDMVQNALISILILSFILLIMFTIFALVKQQYAVQPTSTGEIFGRSFRALIGFLFIPIVCVGGMYLGNIILKGIDGATSAGNTTKMSGRILLTSVYNANYFRCIDDIDVKNGLLYYYANLEVQGDETGSFRPVFPQLSKFKSAVPIASKADFDMAAQVIDNAISSNFESLKLQTSRNEYIEFKKEDLQAILGDKIDQVTAFEWNTVKAGDSIYTGSRRGISFFYNFWEMNYLFLIIAIFFTGYVLCIITFGVVKRIFSLTILYMISPAVLAMYPLDNGNATGQWRGKFIADAVTAYTSVGLFNLFLQVLSLIDDLVVYNPNTPMGPFNNLVVKLIIMIVGCFVVQNLISMISGFFGASDAFGEGKTASGNLKTGIDNIKKGAKTVAGLPGTIVGGGFKAAAKGRDIVKRLGNKSTAGEAVMDLLAPGMSKGIKEGKETMKKTDEATGSMHITRVSQADKDAFKSFKSQQKYYDSLSDAEKINFIKNDEMSSEYNTEKDLENTERRLKGEEKIQSERIKLYTKLLGKDENFDFSTLSIEDISDLESKVTPENKAKLEKLTSEKDWFGVKKAAQRLSELSGDDGEIATAHVKLAKQRKINDNTFKSIKAMYDEDIKAWKTFSDRQKAGGRDYYNSLGKKAEEVIEKNEKRVESFIEKLGGSTDKNKFAAALKKELVKYNEEGAKKFETDAKKLFEEAKAKKQAEREAKKNKTK